MEGANQELLQKLQQERDWHHATIFTDKMTVVADHGCSLQADELK